VAINCPFFVNEYLKGLPQSLVRGRHVRAYPRTARIRHWINGRLSRKAAPGHRPGIRHLTYYGTDARAGVSNIVTVYDMAHERFPAQFPNSGQISRAKEKAVKLADAVICISHHTRKDLLDHIPLDPGKVFVTHLGFTPLGVPASFSPPQWLGESPFILYVGIREGYKNFDRLLKAYGTCRPIARDIRLACLGGGPFNDTEARLIRSLGLEKRVRQLPADDGLLAYAYAQAKAFVYPSIYEGFGIPPLEAMASGCPVLCGSNSSLSEVVGDSVYPIDPLDEQSIAKGLEEVLGSEAEQARLRTQGRKRAALFSWEKCATETLAVYQAVCRHGQGTLA
jgi:glycosyltransferase involved in cell wall biosynthesis